MKISQWIGLAVLTIASCFIVGFYVLFCAMFMVTSEGTWLIAVPIIIIGLNVLSIPIYIYVLTGGWRYLYNICITISTAAVCFYGVIEWAESIHRLKGSIGLLAGIIAGVTISAIGMLISIVISQREKKKVR